MAEHAWRRRLFTGFCWSVGVPFLLFAPMKFYPYGVGSYPSYFEKFVHWGYPWWFSMVVGGAEILAGLMLLLRRRRFIGAVVLILLMTGAVTTHVINHDVLSDSVAAPIELVFSFIIALGSWPWDWREPFAVRMPASVRADGELQTRPRHA